MKKDSLEITNSKNTQGFDRYDDVYSLYQPEEIVGINHSEGQYTFQSANGINLELSIVSESIFRFKYSTNSSNANSPSYALQPKPSTPPPYSFEKGLGDFKISTDQLHCLISRSDMRIRVLDRNNDNIVLNEDALPFTGRRTILAGTEWNKIRKKVQTEEVFYGLGDKSGPLNLRGQKLENWNTDSFGYEADTDPLYRSIPFYYGLHKGIAYGIFLHNTHRSFFDFDSEQNNILSFWATGGSIDYFFIYGPSLNAVAQKYSWLTGVPELPPLWALGFHQCRWSYFPEKRVLEIAETFREKAIPCDAIYLDIDYMDGFRCFTWNKDYFPNPTQMIRDLDSKGFQTVVMIDPGIKVDDNYWVYKDGLNNNIFCRRTNGELMIGPVWPDNCVFPDFTNPKAREWWKKLYTALYLENGVSGFWNDMNEPAVFKVNRLTFPDEVLHAGDGHQMTHAEAHNIYGMQMSRATLEGLKMLKPQKRPFLLTRASFSGGQRYAAIWTGDNIASWEHLRLANIQCQRISISGFSFTGTDIGGFAEMPDGELFVRWLQLGIFHPLFRVHSMGNHSGGAEMVDVKAVQLSESKQRLDQEPWSFGATYTTLARKAIELRYQLLGYMYTAFWKYTQDGTPILRSLAFFDQQDPDTFDRENEFLCGPDLLINPVIQPNAISQVTYLPKGKWYCLWTTDSFQGKQLVQTAAKLDQIPVFVKAGTVLPFYPVRQNVNQAIDEVTLRVYYGESGQSQFYEDQGEGYSYLEGNFKLHQFETTGNHVSFVIKQLVTGSYDHGYPHFKLILAGLPFNAKEIIVDSRKVSFEDGDQTGQIVFNAPNSFKEILITG